MARSEETTYMILYTKRHEVGMKKALNISFRTLLILKKWMKKICCLTSILNVDLMGPKKEKEEDGCFLNTLGYFTPPQNAQRI